MKGGLPTPTSIGIGASKTALNASLEVAKQTKQMVSDCYRQCAQKAKDTAKNLNNQATKYATDTITTASGQLNDNIDKHEIRSTLGGKKRRSTRNIKRTRKYKRGSNKKSGSNKKRIRKRRKITHRR
tara:strand:- start:477 stop:857 length:381 start_codon:yes stop_codon:yes gene_type:complete